MTQEHISFVEAVALMNKHAGEEEAVVEALNWTTRNDKEPVWVKYRIDANRKVPYNNQLWSTTFQRMTNHEWMLEVSLPTGTPWRRIKTVKTYEFEANIHKSYENGRYYLSDVVPDILATRYKITLTSI